MLYKEYRKYCKDLLPNKWYNFVFGIGHCTVKYTTEQKGFWEGHRRII